MELRFKIRYPTLKCGGQRLSVEPSMPKSGHGSMHAIDLTVVGHVSMHEWEAH